MPVVPAAVVHQGKLTSAHAVRPGGALIGYAFGVATRWLLKWLQNHGAKPPQVHRDGTRLRVWHDVQQHSGLHMHARLVGADSVPCHGVSHVQLGSMLMRCSDAY